MTLRETGAETLIALLERQGVRLIAGIPGGANLPLYDALRNSRKIRHVLARHEQGAGFIAQGMARVSGVPAVCFATSGPGATNLLTALADAKLDSTPIVCVTGQVPTAMIGTDAFQEVNIFGMSAPVVKHNYLIRSPEELLRAVPEAFAVAASGRPGPVLIDVPKDIQTAELAFPAWPKPGGPAPRPAPDPAALEEAVARVNAAKRPILFLGGGAARPEAARAARALAEKASIPTIMSLMGLGTLPARHPLALGMPGMHAAPYANLLLEACDLLIAVGVRFDDRVTGKVSAFCPKAEILHADIDPCEIGKNKPVRLGLIADAADFLEALAAKIRADARPEWTRFARRARRWNPMETPDAGNPLSPYGLIAAVAEELDETATIATDVGRHQMWVAQAFPFNRPRQLLTSGGLGTMGFGLPAALGAALARPENVTVCFSGDGSLLMNIQELATLAEENAPVKIVLMNNGSLGLVRQQQDLFYGGRQFASTFAKPSDYLKIAEGFGVPTTDLNAAKNPRAALAAALGRPGPELIHVQIHPDRHALPMVRPGGTNREMVVRQAGGKG